MLRVRLTIEDTVLTATLSDSETTRDFISLLPLNLTLEDYADTEKVSDLPKRLSTTDAPSGSKAVAGDIAYYAPWGNLAIFYRDFRYADGLVILGHLNGEIDVLESSKTLKITIDLVNDVTD